MFVFCANEFCEEEELVREKIPVEVGVCIIDKRRIPADRRATVQVDRQTDRQVDRQTDRQASKQTGRQTCK